MEDEIIEFTQLLGSEVEPGHCVIMSDIDKPSAKMVAVVTRISSGVVYAHYLSRDIADSFKRQASSKIEQVTPVEHFGYRVFYAHREYRCVRDTSLPVIAKYPDGLKRLWQDGSHVKSLLVSRRSIKTAVTAIEKLSHETQEKPKWKIGDDTGTDGIVDGYFVETYFHKAESVEWDDVRQCLLIVLSNGGTDIETRLPLESLEACGFVRKQR